MTSDAPREAGPPQNTRAEKEFFDQAAREQEHGYFSERGWRRLAQLALDFVPDKEKVRILDLGCGTGRLIAELAKALPGADLFGVDISEHSIESASKRGVGTFLVGDILELDLTQHYGTFDLVILSSVLHHFDDSRVVVRCAKRHIGASGRILSYDPNDVNPFFFLYRSPASPISSRNGLSPNERLMSRQELEQAYASEGFVADSFGASGISFDWVQSDTAKFFLPVFNFLDRWLFQDTLLEEPYGCFRICVTRPAEQQAAPACLACRSSSVKRLYFLMPRTFFRCLECGTLFARPLASLNSRSADYHSAWHATLYSQYYSLLRISQAQAILDCLDKSAGHPLDILDVGCGYGYFVYEALTRGHRARGIDVSLPEEVYQSHPEALSRQPLSELIRDGEQFDVVCLLTVLEHVQEPEELLVQVRALLRDDGQLVLSLPSIEPWSIYWLLHLIFRSSGGTIRWPWRTLLQWGSPAPHVFMPSRKGMELLAKRCMESETVASFGQPMTQPGTLGKRVRLEAERTGCGTLKQSLMYVGGLLAHCYDLLTIKLGRPNEIVTFFRKSGSRRPEREESR
ncbi:MAG: methyltransferase domain-containing protein [Candidatus Hydrogenedentes bacterium]|nr:methyltransferase domain-containing protein [Candidatus Hydrogenedentota bacterium]